MEVALEQVGRDALGVPRVGGRPKTPRRPRAQAQRPHDARHPLLAGPHTATRTAQGMSDARGTVATAVRVEGFFDLRLELAVLHRAHAGRALEPLVVAAARDTQYAARACHGNVLPLRVNQLEHGYFTSLAKRAAAFLSSEFSAARSRSRRRSCSTSSRSPWLRWGVLPLSSPSKRAR
jgi:hypothetical protein